MSEMPEYVATEVLPKLVAKTESIDLNVRHGAVIAIGEVVHALSLTDLSNGKKADSIIDPGIVCSIRELVVVARSRGQLRGLGGELLRQAACHAIAQLAAAHAPYHGHRIIDEWLNLIEECLAHEVQVIREKAITALPLVFSEYLKDDNVNYDGISSKDKRKALVEKYCEQLSNTGVNGLVLRMGYARAVGSLPKFVLKEHLPIIIKSLIECTKVTENTQKWAESRRDAVVGVTEVCHTLGVADELNNYMDLIMEALLNCMEEYTIDMRGDIGAWVREASMTGVMCVCVSGAALRADTVRRAASGVAQQAVEKIDRTRAHAGRVFTALLYNEPPIPNIPHHEELKKVFPLEEIELKHLQKEEQENTEHPDNAASESSNVVLWLFPEHTMPRFVQLLNFPVYRYSVIKGLIVSAGELTESLVKHTTQALYTYLHSVRERGSTLKDICDTIIQVFADNLHVKRITGPIFNFLDRLFSSGTISPILEDPGSTFAADVLKYLQLELRGAKNIYKLLDSINVLCQLIQVPQGGGAGAGGAGGVCARALGQLAVYLCYSERYVRRATAARLYEALALCAACDTHDTPPPAPQHAQLEQAMSVLAETDWERDVTELRPIRNELCDLLNIKKPVPKQAAKPTS